MSVTTGTFPGVRIVDMPDLGAFTDNSSIVGEHAGSGRFSATALRRYVETSIINVLDHGAKGDGSTDDTAAIQGVLNTYAGKAIVFIPKTSQPFMVNPLYPPSNSNILLTGMLMLRPNAPGSTQDIGVICLRSVSNCSISGTGIIDGNGVNQTFGLCAGIDMDQATNIQVYGVTLQNAAQWNINCTQCSGVRLDRVTMLGGNNSPEFAKSCDNCWITNSYINGPAQDGGFAFYSGVTNSGAVGNAFTNAYSYGCYIVDDPGQPLPCSGIVISDNIIFSNGSTGIGVLSSGVGVIHSKITISNNVLYGNNKANGATGTGYPSADIWASSCQDVVISGNKCTGCGNGPALSYGIIIGGFGGYPASFNMTVIGNDISSQGHGSTTGVGIFLAPNIGNDVLISGNHIFDNQATQTMLHGISGDCGGRYAIIGNYFSEFIGAQIAATSRPDSVISNAFSLLAGGGGARWRLASGTFSLIQPIEHTNAAGLARWYTGQDGTTESGSNAGSDFEIVKVNDAGDTVTAVVNINRATSLFHLTQGGITVEGPGIFNALNTFHGMVVLSGGLTFGAPLVNAANDAAAASAGIGIGQAYRNGSVVMARVV